MPATSCDLEPAVLIQTMDEPVATPPPETGEERKLVTVLFADLVGSTSFAADLDAERARSSLEPMLAPLRLRLALLRNREADIERLLADALPPPPAKNWWRLTTLAARLDALAALDDRHRVEREAPPLVVPRTYLEPFPLRALGVVRHDEDLISRATASFHALGLDWYAGQAPSRIR
jgi:hypothetical protein